MGTIKEVVASLTGIETSTLDENPDEFMRVAHRIQAFASKRQDEKDHEPQPKVLNEEELRGQIEMSLRSQGIPKRISDILMDVDAFLPTKAVQRTQRWMKTATKEGWCLVLSGGKGCGKSTAAGYWLMTDTQKRAEGSIDRPMPTGRRWWTSSRMARESSYSYSEGMEKIMQTPLMVVDDMGVEYMDKNGFFRHRMDELLDERYSNYRKTVITTNLNWKDFVVRYGERVGDRIREGFPGGGAFFETSERSLRGKVLGS